MHFQEALEQYAQTGAAPARWDGTDAAAEPLTSPFHDWLVKQVDPDGERGVFGSRANLAFDYRAGVMDSSHGIAQAPTDLFTIMRELGTAPEFRVAASEAVAEWVRTSGVPVGIRTELIDGGERGHEGWGAGPGTVERYEYLCPCEQGTILEEHDNIPGFREHDVRLMCESCSTVWQVDDSRPKREWRLVPIAA